MEIAAPPDLNRSPERLYSPEGIGIAAAVGTPLAGAILLSKNYRSLGDGVSAKKTLFWAIPLYMLVVCISITFPKIPSFVWIGVPFGMIALAKSLQGKTIQERVGRGGMQLSNWRALGMGLVWLLPSLALLVLTAICMKVIGTIFHF